MGQASVPIQIPAGAQPATGDLHVILADARTVAACVIATALVREVPTRTKPLFREGEYTDTRFLNRRWAFLRLPPIPKPRYSKQENNRLLGLRSARRMSFAWQRLIRLSAVYLAAAFFAQNLDQIPFAL